MSFVDNPLNSLSFNKLDKLGRRRHPNQNGKKLYQTTSVRVDKETMKELRGRAKKQKITLGQLIREYIEWGLENGK